MGMVWPQKEKNCVGDTNKDNDQGHKDKCYVLSLKVLHYHQEAIQHLVNHQDSEGF